MSSNIFQDVKNLELDITNDLKNLSFTFRWDNKPIDLVDNEYL